MKVEDFFCTDTPYCTTRLGELRSGEVHAVLHLHLRDVGSVSSVEVDRDRELPVLEETEVMYSMLSTAVDLGLDRGGDRVAHGLPRPGAG